MKRFWLANNNLLPVTANTITAIVGRLYHILSSRLFSAKKTLVLLTVFVSAYSCAQPRDNEQKEIEYKKIVTERVKKIVNTLELSDSDRYEKIFSIITNQYFQINLIHEESKTAGEEVKTQPLAKEQTDAALKQQEAKKVSGLLQQHERFTGLLEKNLTSDQIEKVKDAMTYRVFPLTYAAYQDMLPHLTAEQKEKIYNWLKEARELAMDAESADKKHAVFGKYKGKINNYLSAAGYDMKKEGEEWQKRIKEREAKEKNNKM